MFSIIYLALGANLGDTQLTIERAYAEIEKRVGRVVAKSAFYITKPHGFQSDKLFCNSVCKVKSKLSPHTILHVTEDIEKMLGRRSKSRSSRYADRIIDIDLLLVDTLIMETPQLVIPHPQMHKRMFVLEPLAEIAPEVMHPVLRKKIKQLRDSFMDNKL